jgi:hypothetical protein
MRQEHHRSEQPPRQEELAGYFDGELTGARRQLVEQWLADHPEALADLEEWRQLADLTRATRPVEPASQSWSALLERVHSATAPRPRRLHRWLIAATAAAAALLLFLYRAPTELDAEPLQIASPADVEIISMDADDADALVVGHPPLPEALVLVEPADINVEHIEPDHDGSMPSVRWWVGVEAPMIVATLSPEPER